MTTTVDLDRLERLHAEKLKDIQATTWGDEYGEVEAAVVCVYDVSAFGEAEDLGDGTAYEYAGAAAQETADAAVEVCNALPALIAEVRRLRALRDDVTKHCGNTPACRFRPAEVTHDGKAITVMNSADTHRLSAALEELYALRGVAEAAREATYRISTALAKVPR